MSLCCSWGNNSFWVCSLLTPSLFQATWASFPYLVPFGHPVSGIPTPFLLFQHTPIFRKAARECSLLLARRSLEQVSWLACTGSRIPLFPEIFTCFLRLAMPLHRRFSCEPVLRFSWSTSAQVLSRSLHGRDNWFIFRLSSLFVVFQNVSSKCHSKCSLKLL